MNQCKCKCHRINQGHWCSVTGREQKWNPPLFCIHIRILHVWELYEDSVMSRCETWLRASLWGHCEVNAMLQFEVTEVCVRSLWGLCEVTVRCVWGHCEVCVTSLWGLCEVTVRFVWGHCDAMVTANCWLGNQRVKTVHCASRTIFDSIYPSLMTVCSRWLHTRNFIKTLNKYNNVTSLFSSHLILKTFLKLCACERQTQIIFNHISYSYQQVLAIA